MAAQNDFIQQNSFVHFLLLSFLIFDAEYISYKNVKGNKTLNHFSLLLLLLGWQFLLYLFDFRPISDIVSTVLLPICFYQSIYFVQAFLFQESAYRGQKPLLAFLKTSCIIAVFCFFVSDRAFFAAYQLQVLLSTVTLMVNDGATHFPREEVFIEDLTEGEKKVLELVATGAKRKDIAEQLFISERTVSNHLQHIFEKLQVGSTIEAVTKAIQLGYIAPI